MLAQSCLCCFIVTKPRMKFAVSCLARSKWTKTVKLMPGLNGLFCRRFRSVAIALRSEAMSPKLPKSTLRSGAKSVPKLGQVFNPSRLTVARKRTGLTKIEFATRAGVPLRSFKETTDNNESFV